MAKNSDTTFFLEPCLWTGMSITSRRRRKTDKLLDQIHPGAIVCCTALYEWEILDELLTKWEEMGYTFALLELIAES